MQIDLQAIRQIQSIVPQASTIKTSAPSDLFHSMLQSAVNKVETTRATADQKIDRFLSGEGEELHRVVMATQQAELSLELFQQVRNKVVQAYQEIMRMQL